MDTTVNWQICAYICGQLQWYVNANTLCFSDLQNYTRSEIQPTLRNHPLQDTLLRTSESMHQLVLLCLLLSLCLNFQLLLQLNLLKICFFSLLSAILPLLSSSFTNKTINLFPHPFSHLHLHLDCIYLSPWLPLLLPCPNLLCPHPLRLSNCHNQSQHMNFAIGMAYLPAMRQSWTCLSSYLEIIVLRSWGKKNVKGVWDGDTVVS